MRPILVVVAVPESRRRLVEILLQGGYPVAEAESGEVALRLARSVTPGLILIAIVMADENGLEIASRIQRNLNSQSPPIILLGSVPPIGINDEPLVSFIAGYLNINASSTDLLSMVQSHIRSV